MQLFYKLFFLLLTTFFYVNSQETLIFNTTQIPNCSTKLNPCFLDDQDIWNNKLKPKEGDSILIDLSSVENSFVSNIYFETKSGLLNSQSFNNITVIGSDIVAPYIYLINTKLVFEHFYIQNSFLKFDNTDLLTNNTINNIEVNQLLDIKNTTIYGAFTNIVSGVTNVDEYSYFTFDQQSNVTIIGVSQFDIIPKFRAGTNFIASDQFGGYSNFSQGISSGGGSEITLGNTTIGGISQFDFITVKGNVEFTDNAIVQISTELNIKNGQLILSKDSNITISGNENTVISQPLINDNSILIVNNENITIDNASSKNNGTIIFNFISNNFITNSQSKNINILINFNTATTGQLTVSNCSINNLNDYSYENQDGSEIVTIDIILNKNNSINSISTSNSKFTIDNNSLLYLNNSNGKYSILNNDIDIFGKLLLNNVTITTSSNNEINLIGSPSLLLINSSSLKSYINSVGGQIQSYSISNIENSLSVSRAGSISFLQQNSLLNINGDFEFNGTLFFNNSINPFNNSIINVQGQVSLNQYSTLLIDFFNEPKYNDQFNIISFTNDNINSTDKIFDIDLYYDDQLYNNISSKLIIENNQIILLFNPPNNSSSSSESSNNHSSSSHHSSSSSSDSHSSSHNSSSSDSSSSHHSSSSSHHSSSSSSQESSSHSIPSSSSHSSNNNNNNNDDSHKFPGWAIFFIIIFILAIVGGVSIFIFKRIKNNKKDKGYSLLSPEEQEYQGF